MVIVIVITVTTVISIVIIGPSFPPGKGFHGLLNTGRGTSGTLKDVPSVTCPIGKPHLKIVGWGRKIISEN